MLVDTNVVSEFVKPRPDDRVVAWAQHTDAVLFSTTATVLAELLVGLTRLPEGKRRHEIQRKTHSVLLRLFDSRILPFDAAAAEIYARLTEVTRRAGHPMSIADRQIAAVCRVHDLALVTRNVKDFTGCGLRLINPWEVGAGA